jgi:hypothetical protein
LHAHVMRQEREKLPVRRIHAVGEEQYSIHADGRGACSGLTGDGFRWAPGYLGSLFRG